MDNAAYQLRLPGPLEREKRATKILYYKVKTVYLVVLIVVTLLALRGIVV